MTPRFHFISPELFLNLLPGDAPTEDDYEKLRKSDLSSKKAWHELCQELVSGYVYAAVVQSVLDAAGCNALRFLDTTNHKLRGGNTTRKGTFNGGGIYVDSLLARDAAACHWIDIPFWVRISGPHIDAIDLESKRHGRADDGQPSSPCADPTPATDQRGGAKVTTQPGIAPPQEPHFIKLCEHDEEDLSQFIEHILNLHQCYHRMFSYAVYVCYEMVRLFYVDRSGVIVSELFRWDEQNSPLHQFVSKIAKLAKAGRFADLGHDETASLASEEEKNKFLALKDDMSLPQHVRDGFKNAMSNDWPIYKLEVAPGEPSKDEWFSDMTFPPPKEFSSSLTDQLRLYTFDNTHPSIPLSPSDPPKSDVRYFLVGKPHFAADGLIGRCTRGYFAYDVTDVDEKNWRVCFLKDSWRPIVRGRTLPEHLVYQRLQFCGVNKGIGTLICGGDVGGHWAQRTRSQDYLPEDNMPAILRVHYRLVIEEIGVPLKDFDSFPELSAVLGDSIQAHHNAWTLARVLHGDISVGNIMILPRTGNSRRKGILIDWDLSRLECELRNGPVEPDHTGTWQFRSALSLQYPWKPYRRSDDIESFVYVYLYLVLRFHPVDNRSLSELVANLFDGVSLVHGIKTGGDRKLAVFSGAGGKSHIRPSSNPALQKLVQNIISGCSRSYGMVDFDEMEQRYGFAQLLGSEQLEPLSELAHPTSAGIVDFESDDDIPRAEAQPEPDCDSPPIRTAPIDRKDSDPCVVEGFLSEAGNLLDLLKRHASTQLSYSDKAQDQFPARKHQDVYRGPSDAGNLGQVGSQSTSGTLNVAGSSPFSFGGSRNSPSTPSTFADSKKRVRVASGAPAKGATATAGQEPSVSVHRNKRVK